MITLTRIRQLVESGQPLSLAEQEWLLKYTTDCEIYLSQSVELLTYTTSLLSRTAKDNKDLYRILAYYGIEHVRLP